MAITDELRHYIEGSEQLYGCEYRRSRAIADRIDEEHEREVADTRNDALYHANDKDMADLGWYRALDADNVPWRIGDRDECGNEVASIRMAKDGCFYFTTSGSLPCRANIHRHYHEPTVEDTLREFAGKWLHTTEGSEREDAVVAEYAKRLRLAGDVE